MTYRLIKLNEVIRGWINYFALGDMESAIQQVDEHLRKMLRVKEILTRRGLVSPLDYCLKQHALKLNRTAGCRTARPAV